MAVAHDRSSGMYRLVFILLLLGLVIDIRPVLVMMIFIGFMSINTGLYKPWFRLSLGPLPSPMVYVFSSAFSLVMRSLANPRLADIFLKIHIDDLLASSQRGVGTLRPAVAYRDPRPVLRHHHRQFELPCCVERERRIRTSAE